MDRVIEPEMEPHAFAYLDDIIVIGTTVKEHVHNLREVFKRLRAVNLRLNRNKCHFFQRKLVYLGDVVSEKGIHTDPDKVAAVRKLQLPTNPKELRRCLGIAVVQAFRPELGHRRNPDVTVAAQRSSLGMERRTKGSVRSAENTTDKSACASVSRLQPKVRTPDQRERLWTRRRSHPRDGERRTRHRVRVPASDQGRGELFRDEEGMSGDYHSETALLPGRLPFRRYHGPPGAKMAETQRAGLHDGPSNSSKTSSTFTTEKATRTWWRTPCPDSRWRHCAKSRQKNPRTHRSNADADKWKTNPRNIPITQCRTENSTGTWA